MKTLRPWFHGSDVQEHEGAESRFAPLRSRTGFLWLLSSALSLAIGAWLLVGHQLFGVPSLAPAAKSDELVGALVILLTLVSLAKRTRPLRIGNAALGGWLLVTAWFVSGASYGSRWNSLLMGLMLILLSPFLGKRRGM